MLATGLTGCFGAENRTSPATPQTIPSTSQTLDARRKTELATPDGRRQTPNETGGGSTAEASTTTREPLTITTISLRAIEVIGRRGWGAADAGPGMEEHTIERLTIHHTGVELEDNREAPSRLRAHQDFHQRDRGWPDLAYHFAVDREGNIYEGRSTDFRGDTATSYDPTGHFLAVLEGNFDVETPADPQMQSLVVLLAWASDRYSVGVNAIKSHRDYAPRETACPGANLYAQLETGAITGMVEAILSEGPLMMSYLRGASAIERVAAIEDLGS
jgi:hypothetical protein